MLFHLAVALAGVTTQYADTVTITERRCAACSISVQHVVSLGDSAGEGFVAFGAVIARDRRGNYLVSHPRAAGHLIVFRPDGTFDRTVGRAGGGPGEFRRIWTIVPFDSGVMVYDDFARRRTRLDQNLAVVETNPTPEDPLSAVVNNDGSGVMAAIVPSSGLIGFTLHAFDTHGVRTKSFGLSALPYREDLRELFVRELARGVANGSFWEAHRREYAFGRCVQGQDVCRLYTRSVSWFPKPDLMNPWDHDIVGDHPPPPPARLVGVSQDDPRYVWTVSRVPDAAWRSGVRIGTQQEYQVTDANRFFDSIIERIDLVERRVVATTRIDEAIWKFVGPDDAFYYKEDARGVGKVEVVRFQLAGSP